MHACYMHTCLFRKVPLSCNRSSTSACVRSGLTRRPRPPEPAASQPESAESGATPEPHRPRPDAERYVHTVRDLTLPIGDVAVGIGTHSLAGESPKSRRFSPREAPSAAATRCSPEVESAIRCRAAPSRPSRTPCEVAPTTAPHRHCPFSPAGQGVEMCKSVLYPIKLSLCVRPNRGCFCRDSGTHART